MEWLHAVACGAKPSGKSVRISHLPGGNVLRRSLCPDSLFAIWGGLEGTALDGGDGHHGFGYTWGEKP